MRIAIPVASGRVSMHFGHCDRFALVDVDEASRKTGETTLLIPPPCEPGAIPRWLRERGVDVIITGGMGRRAQQLFGENGIQVVAGASPDAPEDSVSAYLSGSLVVGNQPCQHRSCNDIPGTPIDNKSTK